MVIQRGISEALRLPVARLYEAAFRSILAPILGNDERGIELLAGSLNLSHGIVALIDGELVGVAGLHYHYHSFVAIRPFDLMTTFGWRSGIGRLLRAPGMARPPQEHELWVDGIAVTEARRGQGIGAALMNAVVAVATERGYRTLWLEVAAANSAAITLYTKLGFVPMQRYHTGWIARRLGREPIITMVKVV